MQEKVLDTLKPGVLTGDEVQELFRIARENEFALPAVNVVSTNSVNAVMEAANAVNSPVIIQFSNGGAAFWAGKSLPNDQQQASLTPPMTREPKRRQELLKVGARMPVDAETTVVEAKLRSSVSPRPPTRPLQLPKTILGKEMDLLVIRTHVAPSQTSLSRHKGAIDENITQRKQPRHPRPLEPAQLRQRVAAERDHAQASAPQLRGQRGQRLGLREGLTPQQANPVDPSGAKDLGRERLHATPVPLHEREQLWIAATRTAHRAALHPNSVTATRTFNLGPAHHLCYIDRVGSGKHGPSTSTASSQAIVGKK